MTSAGRGLGTGLARWHNEIPARFRGRFQEAEMAQGDGEDRREEPRVGVYQSHRMADPAVPDDVMHGKRFVDPATGAP